MAGGVESMTHFDMMSTLNPEKLSEAVFEHEQARDCLLPMGITSEVVIEEKMTGIIKKHSTTN